MDRDDGQVVAFLSLEEFAEDVIARDDVVRVESITRTLNTDGLPGGLLQYLVVITARMVDGVMAMTSLKVGEVWKIAAQEERYHGENAERAMDLTRQFLEGRGFCVAPGVMNPRVVLDNIVGATTALWYFENKRLRAA